MDGFVWIVFVIVYLGMILGRIPGLALDRTGVALLGAIVLMVGARVGTHELGIAVDEATMVLLFGLMILSAQFRLSGFYSYLVRRVGTIQCSPQAFLALVVGLTALLSAVLVNDVVCLAMTPVLIEVCVRRSLDPKPYLLGLACAANVGSMATLIGNPQNMLIGQVLHLSFSRYLMQAIVPTILGLVIVWAIICLLTAGRWRADMRAVPITMLSFDRWQTIKGLLILGSVIAAFLVSPWPREIVALLAAGWVLCSRRMRSQEMLGLVDWPLLVLFFGLFVVNFAMQTSGNLAQMTGAVTFAGVNLEHPGWLFGATVILSNLVSNVPAVMLLLPSATHPISGPVLALASTLSGNLFIVGSIANIIVVDQAAKMGIRITWKEHARVGVPVTMATLLVAGLWLWMIAR